MKRHLVFIATLLLALPAAAESRLFPPAMVPVPTLDFELPSPNQSSIAKRRASLATELPRPSAVQGAAWCSVRNASDDDGYCDVGVAVALWSAPWRGVVWALCALIGLETVGAGIAAEVQAAGGDRPSIAVGAGVAVRRDEQGIDASEPALVLGVTLALARGGSAAGS